MAYHNLILEKCEDSKELISNLGKLNEERMALQAVIETEEKEKAKLEREAEEILKKLSVITGSLNRKIAARTEFDRTIRQGETTVKNLLETYKNITGVLRSKFSVLTSNDESDGMPETISEEAKKFQAQSKCGNLRKSTTNGISVKGTQ